jgi:hypothetical protein
MKHEADRTFGHYFRNRGATTPQGTLVMTFADAVAKFFSLPCKHTYEVFKPNESVTVQEVSGEVEVLRSTPTTEIKSSPATPARPVFTQQQQEQRWVPAIDHFRNVLRDLTRGQGDIVTAESVLCPDYVNKTEQDSFYFGVREGFRLVLRGLGDEEKEKDAKEKDTKETDAKEKDTKEKDTTEKKEKEKRNTMDQFKKNNKFVYDVAVFGWLTRELVKLEKEPILDAIDVSDDRQIYDKLVEGLAKSSNSQVMGMVSAWRFCCRNPFLYKILKDKDESLQWFDLFQNNVDKADIFGVLAAFFRVGDQVHAKYEEDQANRVQDQDQSKRVSVGVRWLPSVYIVGKLGQPGPGQFRPNEIAAIKKEVKTYNETRKLNKKTPGDPGFEGKRERSKSKA